MHCKYLQVVPYKALENFSKALYGETGGTFSARVFRPVMQTGMSFFPKLLEVNSKGYLEFDEPIRACIQFAIHFLVYTNKTINNIIYIYKYSCI